MSITTETIEAEYTLHSANLNYGGSKLCKSLFYFKNAKPLGSTGWNNLLMHTANCWGEDKLSIEERIQFAEDNLDLWMKWAENPMNIKNKGSFDRKGKVKTIGWQTADTPWEFLAAIFEIKYAIDSGDEYSYVSGLPLAIDCSCSGLQVLSLLSKCHISAPLCNVSSSKERGDLYLEIADVFIRNDREYSDEEKKELDDVIEEIKGMSKAQLKRYTAKNGKPLYRLAKQFWDRHHRKRRSLCKRSVMTFLYSCGPEEMSKHIYEDHKTDKSIEGLNSVFAYYLANNIYRTCKVKLPGPVSIMTALMRLAERLHLNNEDLSFRSFYTNFPFRQEYRADVTKRMKVDYFGEKLGLRLVVDQVRENVKEQEYLTNRMNEKLEKANDAKHKKNIRKMFNKYLKAASSLTDAICGASPNFTHNTDSEALSIMIDNSDFDVKTVHDSIACVPADMDDLMKISREAFRPLFDLHILKNLFKGHPDLYASIKFGEMKEFQMNEFSISLVSKTSWDVLISVIE